MTPLEMSPWQKFHQKYRHGCGNGICKVANRVCLARGSIPCDALFIAEAPGESEDALGKVLCGPAGHYLDGIIEASIPQEVTKAFGNLVGCLPSEGDIPKKAGQPTVEDIEGCSERLKEFIIVCNPKVLICVGTMSRDFLDRKSLKACKMYWNDIDHRLRRKIPCDAILHPSYILRQSEAIRYIMRRRAILTLRSAVNKYILRMEDKE